METLFASVPRMSVVRGHCLSSVVSDSPGDLSLGRGVGTGSMQHYIIQIMRHLALTRQLGLRRVGNNAPPPPDPKSTAAQASQDASITSKVRDAIASDAQLKDLEFTVVTLNGTAASREQIARALALAKSVDGVKSVTNILAVRTS